MTLGSRAMLTVTLGSKLESQEGLFVVLNICFKVFDFSTSTSVEKYVFSGFKSHVCTSILVHGKLEIGVAKETFEH